MPRFSKLAKNISLVQAWIQVCPSIASSSVDVVGTENILNVYETAASCSAWLQLR
jgi:hypothetical protein